jgi:hypothetical protein
MDAREVAKELKREGWYAWASNHDGVVLRIDRLRGLLVTFFYLLLFHPRVFTRVSFERKGRSRQENRDLGIRGQA